MNTPKQTNIIPTSGTRDERDNRSDLEWDLLQQVQNEVQETLLFKAPEHWHDEQLDEIEVRVMLDSRKRLGNLSIVALSSSKTLAWEKWLTVAETRDLILKGAGK